MGQSEGALGFILLGLVFALNTQATVAALPCSLCNLTVRTVTIGCDPDGGVQWNATVTNNASCAVADAWTAQLQVHQPSMPPGQYRTVANQTGSSAFGPGSTTVGGAFCYTAGAGVNSIRVAFAPNPVAGRKLQAAGQVRQHRAVPGLRHAHCNPNLHADRVAQPVAQSVADGHDDLRAGDPGRGGDPRLHAGPWLLLDAAGGHA